MTVYIEPAFLTYANKILNENKFKRHRLKTENEFNKDIETIRMLNNDLLGTIQTRRIQLQRAIQTNELRPPYQWGADDTKYHIIGSDIGYLLRTLDAICENCDATIKETNYNTPATEYGTAILSIELGTTDHENTDTQGGDGDSSYSCKECDNVIDPESIPYFIPDESLEKLKEFLRTFTTLPDINTDGAITNEEQPRGTININDTLMPGFIRNTGIRTNINGRPITQQNENRFPDGKQIQHDIQRHGPAGPQNKTNQKGIQNSLPQDFVFRNNAMWTCRKCETLNKGENRKCQTKTCQLDKFTPTKNIKITL